MTAIIINGSTKWAVFFEKGLAVKLEILVHLLYEGKVFPTIRARLEFAVHSLPTFGALYLERISTEWA
jgi:hypothetical protein